MKITITARDNHLDADVDPRFGRCRYFLFIDTETMNVEAYTNNQQSAMGGAGIQAAQYVANKDVDVVITGSVGPNAFQTLHAAGLKIYTGAQGKVKDVLEQFRNGKLHESTQATVGAHAGMRHQGETGGGIR
jgi:predicted Fe-Mo cluster-binding NifX family protein